MLDIVLLTKSSAWAQCTLVFMPTRLLVGFYFFVCVLYSLRLQACVGAFYTLARLLSHELQAHAFTCVLAFMYIHQSILLTYTLPLIHAVRVAGCKGKSKYDFTAVCKECPRCPVGKNISDTRCGSTTVFEGASCQRASYTTNVPQLPILPRWNVPSQTILEGNTENPRSHLPEAARTRMHY